MQLRKYTIQQYSLIGINTLMSLPYFWLAWVFIGALFQSATLPFFQLVVISGAVVMGMGHLKGSKSSARISMFIVLVSTFGYWIGWAFEEMKLIEFDIMYRLAVNILLLAVVVANYELVVNRGVCFTSVNIAH